MRKLQLTYKGQKYIITLREDKKALSNYNMLAKVYDKDGLLFGWSEKDTVTDECLKLQVKAHINQPDPDIFI